MKLLLDESVPKPLARYFPETLEVRTVQQMGWAGCNNGDLLKRAAAHGFAALITADQGIEYQQNLATLPIAVLVLIAARTRLQELRALVPQVLDIVAGIVETRVYRITDTKTTATAKDGVDF